MDYQASLSYLLERLPMFQRVGKAAMKADLNNTWSLLAAMGNPQHNFKSVHIAGTNGKGTSAHAISSILVTAGYKTGLYTSPHLKSFTERIRVNGQEVQEAFIADFVTKHQQLFDQVKPSFFEVTVVMAFEYFRQQEVDVAVIETGLGGRLDSTNVINPVVSLITMIGFDHMDLLGNTLEKIASEKAGIIKKNVPVVIGNDQQDIRHVFDEVAQTKNAKIYLTDGYRLILKSKSIKYAAYEVYKHKEKLDDFTTDITADYFALNVPGIIETVAVLRETGMNINKEDIQVGLSAIKDNTGLKGRMQMLDEQPLILVDVSHNVPGLSLLFSQVNDNLKGKLHIVFGVVRDKDLEGIFKVLPVEAYYYWTTSKVPRSLPAEQLRDKAREFGIQGDVFKNVNEAILGAKKLAGTNDIILICGSTFVVAEIDDL